MKKLLFVLFVLGFISQVFAVVNEDEFGRIYFSSDTLTAATKLSQPILMNFNYPGVGSRNCITDISASNINFPGTWSLYILDGQSGTTAYTMIQSTGVIQEDFYRGSPLCLSNSATTYIYISTGNFKVNVSGYQRP